MKMIEIVNGAQVNQEFNISADFPFDRIKITQNHLGEFSWSAKFNQKIFQGNQMTNFPMVGKMVKHWKKESSARLNLAMWLESKAQ